MKRSPFILTAVFAVIFTPVIHAEVVIEKATLTEVVNSVSIIDRSSKKTSSAKVQQVLNAPNFLRTGADSRAELIADDKTVTRVGQNTLFSFQQDSREINLEKGSLLFQSPSGKGGGTINTPAASAAVLGTTMIVSTTKNGGFKVLLLEGKGKVKPSKGRATTLRSGQMVYALPGGTLSPVYTFQLSQQVAISKLVGSFKKKLPSSEKIDKAIAKQEKEIASGEKIATNLLASDSPEMALQVDVAQDTLAEELVEGAVDETVSPFQLAITSDAIVDSPELDPAHTFTFDGENTPELDSPPVTTFSDPEEAHHHSSLQTGDAAIFIANNIFFRTPTVDLSSFNGRSVFQFIAINDINIEQSLTLDGLSDSELHIIAGNTFVIPSGTTLTTDSKQLTLVSLGSQFDLEGGVPDASSVNLTPLEIDGFTMVNTNGGLSIFSGATAFSAIQMQAKGNIMAIAAGDLNFDSKVNFNPAGSSVPIPNAPINLPDGINSLETPEAAILKAGNDVNIKGMVVKARRTSIHAGNNITLKQVAFKDLGVNTGGSFTNPRPSVHMRAEGLLDVNTVLFAATDVMLQAHTLNLKNVHFQDKSRVILESALGVESFASTPQPGHVNFLGNVRYGSILISDSSDLSSVRPSNFGNQYGVQIQKLGPKP